MSASASASASAPAPASEPADVASLRSHLQFYSDWPKPGVTFCDILPIFRDPLAFETLINHLLSHVFTKTMPSLPKGGKIDAVVGLDARGFILAPILAMRLGAAFVPVRKQGKLPGNNEQAKYLKEYGEDIFEIPSNSIPAGANVLVVDDLIATGGSAGAAGELIAKLGAKTVEYLFVIEIPFLKGVEKLDAPAYAIIQVD